MTNPILVLRSKPMQPARVSKFVEKFGDAPKVVLMCVHSYYKYLGTYLYPKKRKSNQTRKLMLQTDPATISISE